MGLVKTTAFWFGFGLAGTVFEVAADWLADTMLPGAGGISDRKCAVFVAEGGVAAAVAMVTALAC